MVAPIEGLKSKVAELRTHLARLRAVAWGKSYRISHSARSALAKHKLLIIAFLGSFAAVGAWLLSAYLQPALSKEFSNVGRLDNLRTLLITLGASLLGATAIGFSFVMFAMQVNVERMPHGLFRRFSNDPKLMGSFAATFALAISICIAGLIPSAAWAAAALILSVAASLLVFILLLYSYGRALTLINPAQQLALVISITQRQLSKWVRRVDRARPLLLSDDAQARDLPNDMARVVYFKANPYWSSSAYQGLRYAMAFAGRYAARADYEVTAAALQTVIAVNTAYVAAKGKTFFTDNVLFDNPMSSDGFINETLEGLRQAVASAVSSEDEKYLGQLLWTFEHLAALYGRIDYARPGALPKHSLLTITYLFGAVEAALGRSKTDAVMEGLRGMGRSALALLASTKNPMNIVSTVDKIGPFAAGCCVAEKARPITLAAVDQLAKITLATLRTDNIGNTEFALKQVNSNLMFIAKVLLALPDAMNNTHSTYLGPYYSTTSLDSFLPSLVDLANAVLQAPPESKEAKKVIRNLIEWTDDLGKTQKELFLLSVEKRSQFTFDAIHWTGEVIKLLLAICNAPACDDRAKESLTDRADKLIAVLTRGPSDREGLNFCQNWGLGAQLFDIAREAHFRDAPEISTRAANALLEWGFREVPHPTGWAILEHAIEGYVSLASSGEPAMMLKQQIIRRLAQYPNARRGFLAAVARNLREKADTLDTNPYEIDPIQHSLQHAPREDAEILLREIADLLSPPSAGEEISSLHDLGQD